MKRASRFLSSLRTPLRYRLLLAVLMAVSLAVIGATPPAWWSERGVLKRDAQDQPVPADDYAVEMMVDANRDGEMSFTEAAIHDKDDTTAKKPYRFWLNNDHDVYHPVDGDDNEWDDASDTATWKDCNYTSIYTTRDLEDFTRLRITFKGLTDLVKNTEYSVYLEWRAMDGAQTLPTADGAPDINVYQEKQPDVRPLYLEDQVVASHQRDTPYDTWIGGVRPGQPMDLFAMRPALRTALSESTPTVNLLFCGKTAGRGQLILTIKKGTQLIGQYPPVYIARGQGSVP
jgi:hypothetical protein